MDETFASIAGHEPEAASALDAARRDTAYWRLAIAGVRPFMSARLARGELCQADWASEVLERTFVVDLNERSEHLLGGPGGREELIGRPIAEVWPTDSKADLAEMIAEVAMDPSPRAVRVRGISSLLLNRPEMTVRRSADGGRDTVIVTVTGPLIDHRSYWSVRASEERYRNLIRHLPNPLLRIDTAAMASVFAGLRAEGVYDFGLYLDAHPELIEFALQSVLITEVNPSAAALFGAASAADLTGPVRILFQASPDTVRRIMIANFEGRRSHAEVMKLRRLDGRLLDVQFSVTYP
uniref:PAS domain-containing protein n=1 Tax=Inquilinus sp. TaxID=1932117 RepID=UPI0031DC373D